MTADPDETHPIARFGEAKGWGYAKTAKFFAIPYGAFKQMVRGFTGCSFRRAVEVERRSRGHVRALDLMNWHRRNCRRPKKKTKPGNGAVAIKTRRSARITDGDGAPA